MDTFAPSPVSHDLDGLTFPTNYLQELQLKQEVIGLNNGFGFDPSTNEQIMFGRYLNNANTAGNWNGFSSDDTALQQNQLAARRFLHRPSLSLPQQGLGMVPLQTMQNNNPRAMHPMNFPTNAAAMSHYGQVTPPRSNSAGSLPSKDGDDSTRTAIEEVTKKRRRGKAQAKTPLTPPETSNNSPKTRKASGRKAASTIQTSSSNPEDDKRKASLEKNRVAAAKCRINKKEKTEQLQRDSHTKAKENIELRGLLETMETELHTLTAYLTAHANCADCRNPDQLQEALQMIQDQEMRKRFPGLGNGSLSAHSPVLSSSGQSMDSPYYGHSGLAASPSEMNPPLPEFNLGGDLDMNSMNSPLPPD